jgi:hypothetical protein
MAQDDIYEVKSHFQNPSSASSVRLYYQEQVARSGVGTDCSVLAQSWATALATLFRNCLADDWFMTSVVARKVDGDPTPKWRDDLPVQVGVRAGPALPSNNAMLMQLQQGLFPSSSNGRVFIPGVAEGDTLVGNLTGAFMSGPLTALAAGLVAQLAEESAGTGRWDLGVISVKVLDAAPPAKDWQGAFSQVFGVGPSPIVATQRRRQTKVVGAAL